jgi:hypothetical protein
MTLFNANDAQVASVFVDLSWYESRMAAEVGFFRQLKALTRNDAPAFPERYPGQLWYNHIAGACAELAVAKYLGVYWGGGVDTFNVSDMEGHDFEIRFSPVGKPKVRPRDTRPVIAVTGNAPQVTRFEIVGWISPAEARRDEWQSKDEPICWFPPRTAWHSIDTLEVTR